MPIETNFLTDGRFGVNVFCEGRMITMVKTVVNKKEKYVTSSEVGFNSLPKKIRHKRLNEMKKAAKNAIIGRERNMKDSHFQAIRRGDPDD